MRDLRELGAADRPEVGVKAATLGEMLRAGLPVPAGVVLPVGAAADERAAEAAVAALGDGPLAVRSSALAEDLPEASHAGEHLTLLGVRGAEETLAAMRRCAGAEVAVLVQPLVAARAAGVAFSADPVSGDRDTVVVSAVKGLGDRLASGGAAGDEWVVRGETATRRRGVEDAIDAATALAVAALARRVAALAGAPQDIEWALGEGGLALLQARPITALPPAWTAPPGAWARNFRLGEWLPGPVTPLFETWLLPRLEEAFGEVYQRAFGFKPRPPHHVVVNGWMFSSLNFLPSTPLGMMRALFVELLPRLLLRPRYASLALPPLAGLGIELHVRDWRERVLPAYRAAVREAEARVEVAGEAELRALIDGLARQAGAYFASVTFVAGFAWKAELPLAEWLRPRGIAHLPLLAGLGAPDAPAWAVTSLDWASPTLGELPGVGTVATGGGGEQRRAAEEAARRGLGARDRRRFDRLLARAQRFARLREEQVRDFTLAWPVLRRAVARLGREDVYFLRLEELDAPPATGVTAARRAAWERQRRWAPPLVLGEAPPILRALTDRAKALHVERNGAALVEGLAASPGRASGVVRVVRGPDEFDRFAAGEILVAPATTPAWLPVLARAAAVVTDAGSILAHASILARELGIPAVIGAVDATRRLTDGQRVTVDGDAGIVT